RLVALALLDGDRAALRFDIGKRKGDGLRAPEPTTVQHTTQGSVAGAGRRAVGTGGKQGAQLAAGQGPASGERGAADAGQVGGAALRFGGHEPEPAALP